MRTRWRWLSPALVLISLLGLVPTADARWKIETVMWRRQNNATGYNGGVFGIPSTVPFDTLYASAAPSRSDTTAPWSMLDCDNMTQVAGGVGGNAGADDSLASAYLVIQADSTVASTVDFKSTTILFQVNYGSNNTGWQTVNTTAYPHNFTAGCKIVHQPIWTHISGLVDKDAMAEVGGASTGGGAGVFAPQMRAIITWGAASAAPTSRLFIKKWITEQNVQLQGKDY